MQEPKQLENRLRKYIDETCEHILNIMLARNIYKADKIRYNALFNISKAVLKLSKPTFNAHIQHLTAKKLVNRERKGKQEVYFYLNPDNLMIKNERIIANQLKEESTRLLKLMQKPEFWDVITEGLAMYGTLCSLRRWRMILEYLFTPNRAKENLFALSLQARFQQNLEDYFMIDLINAIEKLPSEDKKRKYITHLITVLDEDIKGIGDEFKQLVAHHNL